MVIEFLLESCMQTKKIYLTYLRIELFPILIGLCFLLSSISVFSQNNRPAVDVPVSASFLFSYRQQSRILLKDYKYNHAKCDQLNSLIRRHRPDIISGKSHLAITAFIRPCDLKEPQILNVGSIQGSVARAYVKVLHSIEHKYCTFAFDTAHYTNYQVRIDYVSGPVPDSANQDIFYSLKRDAASILRAIKRYNPIPVIGEGGKWLPVGSGSRFEEDNVMFVDSIIKVFDAMKSATLSSVASKMNIPHTLSFLLKKGANKPLKSFNPLIGVKTNLLYWAGLTPEVKQRDITPNLELEYYFSKRFSLNIDAAYTYMDKKNTEQELWGVSSFSVEPRFWLKGNRQYNGFYFGIYTQTGQFDVKLNAISAEGHTGAFHEGGFSLGYYLPISSRWGLEAGGRYGYRLLDGDVYTYELPGHFYYQSSFKNNGFKLTGLRLLLTYRLGKSIKLKSDK